MRDAADWLELLTASPTEQVTRQLRDLRTVFTSRPTRRRDAQLRFIGLPSAQGLPPLAGPGERVDELTVASPFWPTGNDPADVAGALARLCGGGLGTGRLIGPAALDEQGNARPEVPAGLVSALLRSGARVQVAAADPGYGCDPADEDDKGEFDEVAERHGSQQGGNRSLHAKALLAIGKKTTRLAIGSFNLTRKGLGLVRAGNAEAGLLWTLPNRQASRLRAVVSFATAWRHVTRRPEEFCVEPRNYDGDNEGGWPGFILSLVAKRDELTIKGDAATWPDEVVIRMKDIRSRLLNQERWFDPWTVRVPTDAVRVFSASTPLRASWWDQSPEHDSQTWPALPDLEAEVSWNGGNAVVPVVFEDKHLFPVVESRSREDEQSLIAWFLGLRPAGEMEDGGFGHSIDPIPNSDEPPPTTGDILSYLVRDFVHALPGIRNRLADAGMTETGLRAALLGYRSPVELARESLRAFREPPAGKPRKTAVATAFQLAELRRLLQIVPLPDLGDDIADGLRAEAVAAVSSALDEVVAELPPTDHTHVVRAYLAMQRGQP